MNATVCGNYCWNWVDCRWLRRSPIVPAAADAWRSQGANARDLKFSPPGHSLPTCPPSVRTRPFGQGPDPSQGGLTVGTHRTAVPLLGTAPNPTVLVRKSQSWESAAQDESRPKNSGRTRLRKKPEHPLEVCPPVRIRAYPDVRTAADRLARAARGHSFRDGRGTIAGGDEFPAIARWCPAGRIARGKSICATTLRGGLG